MHVAIDDTYGGGEKTSAYVSDKRRTHVAVFFDDDQVDYIRIQLKECLGEVTKILGKEIEEFHFVDIFNRKNSWEGVQYPLNLNIFKFFSKIYSYYRWQVVIQTIDERTFNDHPDAKPLLSLSNVAGFDLRKRDHVSLFMTLTKTKHLLNPEDNLTIIVDEGITNPGKSLGKEIFRNWKGEFSTVFQSSKNEPQRRIFYGISIFKK